MTTDKRPLVSCIMPTKNRPRFVERSIRYFQRQRYPNLELVVVDDGESVEHLIPDDERILYYRSPAHLSLGEKRNMCVRLSRGEVIMHWDDDDWIRHDRVEMQIGLMLSRGVEVVGSRTVLFWDVTDLQKVIYCYGGSRPWVFGATMVYTRKFWERSPFPDRAIGSDSMFMLDRQEGPMQSYAAIDDVTYYVAIRHGQNVAQFDFKNGWAATWPAEMTNVIPDVDIGFYLKGDWK